MSESITGVTFEVRRVQSGDSLDELTGLIHRAFEPLGRLGLRCAGVNQEVLDTARRIGRGDCLLALRERRVVGTVTMEASDDASTCSWYRRRDVASLHQFAVEPAEQGWLTAIVACVAAFTFAFKARVANDRASEESLRLRAGQEKDDWLVCAVVWLNVLCEKTAAV